MMTSPEALRKMTANMAQKFRVIFSEYQPWLLVSGLSKNSLHQEGRLTLNSFFHQHQGFLGCPSNQEPLSRASLKAFSSCFFYLQLCQQGKNIIHVSNLTIKPEICRAVLVVIFGLKLAVTLTVPYPGPLLTLGQSEAVKAPE